LVYFLEWIDIIHWLLYCESFLYSILRKEMLVKFTPILTAIAASCLIFNVFASAAEAKATNFNAEQKTQIETVVHDYIMKNPQVLIDAVNNMQKEQYEKMQQKTQQTAIANADSLFRQANDPVVGNAKGKVTIVDFFDYQCPHCVDMEPALEAIVKANPEVRIVFKDFPIRGAMSVFAAKAALAANKQGKYWEFHQGLMKAAQGLTEAKALEIAKNVGLDVDKLKKDMDSSDVDQQIKATYKLAQDLSLMGTPALFIAKSDISKTTSANTLQFIAGQADQKTLQAAIDKAQK
jgi:protein-disulfide isomerase